MSGKIRRALLPTSNDEVMITTKQIHVYIPCVLLVSSTLHSVRLFSLYPQT
jgi:hypothetical protein